MVSHRVHRMPLYSRWCGRAETSRIQAVGCASPRASLSASRKPSLLPPVQTSENRVTPLDSRPVGPQKQTTTGIATVMLTPSPGQMRGGGGSKALPMIHAGEHITELTLLGSGAKKGKLKKNWLIQT